MRLDSVKIEDYFDVLDERGISHARSAGQGVARGMEPWVPENVILFVEYNIDLNCYRVTADAIGKSWCYSFAILIDFDDIVDPLKWSEKLYYGFLKAFRNREIDPIPDNIELGEN